jgi:hypothetical protein
MRKNFTRTGTAGLAAAAVVTAGGLLMTGVGVYAGLNAVATGSTGVTSGTLSLTLGADGNSTGFPQTVSNIAPGDVYNTYVNLTNGTSTSLAGKDITLAVAAPSSNPLITPPSGDGGTVGLTVTVNSCSVAWTVTPGTPGSATCSGTGGATQILAPTAVSSLSTAASLISGAIAPAAVYHLQMTLTLPSNLNETTTNGTPPTQTIQGQSVTLNYTFGETQRTATTTNS